MCDVTLTSDSAADLASVPPLVHRLVARNCGLETLSGLHVPLLESIDLRGNYLCSIFSLAPLLVAPGLRDLSVGGNPICTCPAWRDAVLQLLPWLDVIDGEAVTLEQRRLVDLNPLSLEEVDEVIDYNLERMVLGEPVTPELSKHKVAHKGIQTDRYWRSVSCMTDLSHDSYDKLKSALLDSQRLQADRERTETQLVTELEAALKDLEELRTCSVQASLEVASLKTQNAEVKEELRGTRERYDETRGQLLTRALEGKSEAEQQSALKLQETVRILRQEMESQFLSQMEAARRHHSEELAVERQKTQSLSEELRARGDGTQLDLLRSELDELQRNYDDLRDLAQRVKDESQDYEVQVLSLQQALTRADSMCSSQAEQMQDVDCRLRQLDNERVQAEALLTKTWSDASQLVERLGNTMQGRLERRNRLFKLA